MLHKKTMSTAIGQFTIVASDKGVRSLLFEKQQAPDGAVESNTQAIIVQCEQQLQEYFKGRLTEFNVPLDPQGTEFQKEVWKALKKIPFGRTVSYSEQAIGMGKKSSVRAVAAANGRNPIAIIIPCHRVIASTGHLHGYAGGLELKRKLLEIEGLKIQDLRVNSQ